MTVAVTRELPDLYDLAEWLHSPENRLAWHNSRLVRQTEAIEQERRTDHAERPSVAASAEDIAKHRDQLADAQARADLAVLGEKFAEATRLRLTATLAEHDEEPEDDALRDHLADDISETVRDITIDLLLARHVYQGEAYRNAAVALAPLLNPHRALEATGEPASLGRWLRELQTAARVLTQSPTTD